MQLENSSVCECNLSADDHVNTPCKNLVSFIIYINLVGQRLLCEECYIRYNNSVFPIKILKSEKITPKEKKNEMKNEILHQAWLKAACELIRQNMFDFPEVVATYGFPAPNSSDGFRGACHWPTERSAENRPVIIIHPAEWNNSLEVLTILVHECLHAKLGKEENHGDVYEKWAKEIGLVKNEVGVWDRRTPELEITLNEALKLLPPMPQDPLGRGKVTRQKGRMHLFMCTCGFKIRCGKKELAAGCHRCNTPFVLKEV